MEQSWTLDQVTGHNKVEDCWMAIHGSVYDITPFISIHPGGQAILLRNAGQDATAAFDSVHPVEILDEHSEFVHCMGSLVGEAAPKDSACTTLGHQAKNEAHSADLPIDQMLSLAEMESNAVRHLSSKALSYYASGTDDELTMRQNGTIFKSVLLRPRIFKDCTSCDLSTTILGERVGLPIFVAPAAMAKLAHPSGEAGIASACSTFKALQIISKNASMSVPSIVTAGSGAVFAWQLYVLKDIAATEKVLQQIRAIPQIKFIVLTLDAPFPGKREADVRFKMAEMAGGAPAQAWGTESALTWQKTLAWLSTQTNLPIVLKGIQCHEDAYTATKFPAVKGIILSNHGGRAVDTAPTPLQVLLEIRKFCPEVLGKIDVMIDGGIRRGTDVVKALALGAKGVGIGRAALYGLALAGEKGVEQTLRILADETATAMRLLGVTQISELGPRHVVTAKLNSLLYDGEAGLERVDREIGAKL